MGSWLHHHWQCLWPRDMTGVLHILPGLCDNSTDPYIHRSVCDACCIDQTGLIRLCRRTGIVDLMERARSVSVLRFQMSPAHATTVLLSCNPHDNDAVKRTKWSIESIQYIDDGNSLALACSFPRLHYCLIWETCTFHVLLATYVLKIYNQRWTLFWHWKQVHAFGGWIHKSQLVQWNLIL